MNYTKKSLEAIEQADKIRTEQNQVIKETIEINEDIAQSIVNENVEFGNITEMMQGNAQDIVSLSNQVENINTMITELEQLLNT